MLNDIWNDHDDGDSYICSIYSLGAVSQLYYAASELSNDCLRRQHGSHILDTDNSRNHNNNSCLNIINGINYERHRQNLNLK